MAQQQLTTDSPLSHRIVRSFLHFITSVEPAPGVDVEGLEVAKQCLAEVFNVDQSSAESIPDGDSLIHIFQSHISNQLHHNLSNINIHGRTPISDTPAPSSVPTTNTTKYTEAEDWSRDKHTPGLSTDELFGQFIGALEQIRYFKSTPDGNDDPVQMDRASQVFYTAVENLQSSGCETLDPKTLAESLKSQGNKAMQSNHFSEAIEFYTFAIALNLHNAVYYCNRAAAFTQIHQYAEAIEDCLKAVKIDPNYSKAYSRLGFAYYAQGKYADAIEKGFIRALQLDPNNESVRENIRVAEQKLKEEHQRAQHSQSSGSASQPSHQSAGGPRMGMPFNINHVPPELASYFMNMTQGMHSHDSRGDVIHTGVMDINFGGQMPAENSSSANGQPNHQSAGGPGTAMPEVANFFMNMTQGRHSHGGPGDDVHTDDSGTGIGGNINVNFGEQMRAEDSSSASHHGQPNHQSAGGPRTSMPFNLNAFAPEVANLFTNATQGRHSHGGPEDDIQAGDPGTGSNININLGEQMPAEVSGALRSVMEMFSRATHGGGDDNFNGRPSI